MTPDQFNPLDKENLGLSVADALIEQPINSLPLVDEFIGAGVYALYYHGAFQPYAGLAALADRLPIYVGKAVPPGSRKGGYGLGKNPGPVLFGRLSEHGESIGQAENLELKDFTCRFLLVDDIWIPLGESLLIQKFAPVWNTTITGFGIHDPGKGRGTQKRSAWDTLHPGRPFATDRPDNEMTAGQLAKVVEKAIAILVFENT